MPERPSYLGVLARDERQDEALQGGVTPAPVLLEPVAWRPATTATAASPREVWAATAARLAGVGRVRLAVKRGDSVSYPAQHERDLTDRLPGRPAAVRVYGHDGACVALFLDLDSSRGGVETVTRQARDLRRWLTECGARFFEDSSPNGGRHIYIPLAERLPQPQARELVEALALRFSTIDAAPHRSARSGCIRTPGSQHRSGGHQELVDTLSHTVDVLHRPNGDDVVQALQVRLAPQVAAWRSSQTAALAPGVVDLSSDEDGIPVGEDQHVSKRLRELAREGRPAAGEYRSPSEARMAVLAGAARAGWNLAAVALRMKDGRWPGLAAMFATKGTRSRTSRTLLATEWRKAQTFVITTPSSTKRAGQGGSSNVLRLNTSPPKSHGGHGEDGLPDVSIDPAAEHRFIRTWTTALFAMEVHRFAGKGPVVRWLLRALAEAAHKSGSRYVRFGVRSLAVATGCGHVQVAAALKELTQVGWIDRLEVGRGKEADLYALTLPHDLRGRAEALRWHSGRVHALRPAFRGLGAVAGLVFEAVELGRATTITTLVEATGFSRSAVAAAVDALMAYRAFERVDGELVAHPERLGRIAEDLGVLDDVAAQIRTYARHRRLWHAYLDRHAEPNLVPADIWDPEIDEWWLPPDDDPAWTLLEAA